MHENTAKTLTVIAVIMATVILLLKGFEGWALAFFIVLILM
jgi:type IV secretory pathway VirB2 component (pilin)